MSIAQLHVRHIATPLHALKEFSGLSERKFPSNTSVDGKYKAVHRHHVYRLMYEKL
jgi:hypothetical protein